MHKQAGIGDVSVAIGMLFSAPKETWEKLATQWAEETLQRSRNAGIDVEANDYTLIHIALPCGERLAIKTVADMPRETMPCPCGDPGHYLVKYTE